jgi:hypothetical protein
MRTWLIGIAVAVVAAALGVGAANGGSAVMKAYRPQNAAVEIVRPANVPAWFGGRSRGERLRDGSRDGRPERMRDRMQDWMFGGGQDEPQAPSK